MIIIDPETFCEDEEKAEPVAPLNPVTVCEINKMIRECNYQDGEINPDCVANPRLCRPPTQCDLPGNTFLDGCREEVDCERDENRGNIRCKHVSRCDDPSFAEGRVECEKTDPCGEDGTLCLTVCDMKENESHPLCKI